MALRPLALAAVTTMAFCQSDLQLIVNRIISDFSYDSTSIVPIDDFITSWLQIQAANGSFADINYSDTNIAFWQPINHTLRARDMASAFWSPPSRYFNSSSLLASTLRALDYWLLHPSVNSNWWFKQIGIPAVIGPTAVMLAPFLAPNATAAAVILMNAADTGPGSEANCVWEASNMLYNAALQRNDSLMATATSILWGAVTVVSGGSDGIRSDWSFWEHGTQIYSGGYGMAYVYELMTMGYYTAGTAYAMPPTAVGTLENMMLNGSFRMVFFSGAQQGYFGPAMWDVSTIGREIARPYGSDDVFGAAGQNVIITPAIITQFAAGSGGARADDLIAIAPAFGGNVTAAAQALLVGSHAFPQSDYHVHRTAQFMTTTRMTSVRTVSTEGINAENEFGYHLADGAQYLYLTGYEYVDLFPAWDWQRVPGTTVKPFVGGTGLAQKGLTSFIGGASSGAYGVVSMDWIALNSQGLELRRTIAYFGDAFVVLLANVTDTLGDGHPVWTTIEQRVSTTPVYTSAAPTVPLPSSVNVTLPASTWWVWEGNVGYIFIYSANASAPGGAGAAGVAWSVSRMPQNGTWEHIGQQTGYVEATVFALWALHAPPVAAQTAAYIVVPAVDVATFAATAQTILDNHVLLRNDADAQAVLRASDGVLSASVYAAGGASINGGVGFQLSVNRNCSIIMDAPSQASFVAITAALPTHAAWNATFTLDRTLQPSQEPGNASCSSSSAVLTTPPADGTSQTVICTLVA